MVEQHESVELQLSCLVRVMVIQINSIRATVNMPPMSYSDIQEVFTEMGAFQARPDWKNHLESWYMGVPLDSLPEPLEEFQTESDELESLDDSMVHYVDFGGDYASNDRDDENQTGTSEPDEALRAEDQLSEMCNDNSSDCVTTDGQDRTAMSEMSDKSPNGEDDVEHTSSV